MMCHYGKFDDMSRSDVASVYPPRCNDKQALLPFRYPGKLSVYAV
jgi:hypothetical protein